MDSDRRDLIPGSLDASSSSGPCHHALASATSPWRSLSLPSLAGAVTLSPEPSRMATSLPESVSSKARDVTVQPEFYFPFLFCNFFSGVAPPCPTPTLSRFGKGAGREGQLPGGLSARAGAAQRAFVHAGGTLGDFLQQTGCGAGCGICLCTSLSDSGEAEAGE